MVRVHAGAAAFAAALAGVALLGAATPSIGVAVSDGNIRINDARTAGNASIFNGTTLETERPAQVRLNAGGNLNFGTASRAKVYSDHVDLEQGSARFSGVSTTANGLSVRPDSNSSANVELHGKVVQVAALTGSVHVFNRDGINVANLVPGRALNLQDAGASAPTTLTGCVTRSGDNFILADEASKVTVQLRGGSGLRAGTRFTVTGTTVTGATPSGGATQVVAVTKVTRLTGGCAMAAGTAGAAAGGAAGAAGAAAGAAGAGAGAAGAAAGAAAAGISATTAVVAGVAAAAVGVGTGVAASGSSGTGSGATGGAVNPGCVGISPCTP